MKKPRFLVGQLAMKSVVFFQPSHGHVGILHGKGRVLRLDILVFVMALPQGYMSKPKKNRFSWKKTTPKKI
jgi:hypothetical protein